MRYVKLQFVEWKKEFKEKLWLQTRKGHADEKLDCVMPDML